VSSLSSLLYAYSVTDGLLTPPASPAKPQSVKLLHPNLGGRPVNCDLSGSISQTGLPYNVLKASATDPGTVHMTIVIRGRGVQVNNPQGVTVEDVLRAVRNEMDKGML
jgi:hypothetical protein